ncbi:MAG: triphosphoribosyl-dephospho-CoA synthase MdcB, partial [Rhodocyclaceae bacterium]
MSDALAVRREDFRPAVFPTASVEGFAARVGSLAIRALYREVELSPKPGLVSPADSGSHTDMDFRTFVRSLQSLRDYFPEIARVGAAGPSFEPLRQLGVAAEAKMLQATGGINTHRGAIFNIGLLCAAAGALHAEGRDFAATDVCVE